MKKFKDSDDFDSNTRKELENYKNLIFAVDRYRIAHSLYESNKENTFELYDSYVNMLVKCDNAKKEK